MSATSGVDARGYLCSWAGILADMTSKDIRAIPEDKWMAAYGGCSQAASGATADTIGMLNWTTEALKGNVITGESSYISQSIKDACATREGAVASLVGAAGAFSAALSAASDDALNAVVMTPWGMPTPLYMIAQIAASHIWYHDGQINYIQTLLGDDKVHWMES